MGPLWYQVFLFVWIGLSAAVFVVLLKVPAPYGRAVRRGWGPRISARAGWLVMEMPALVVFAGFFLWCRLGGLDESALVVSAAFLCLWQGHYLHRAVIYPLRMRGKQSQTTVSVVAMAVAFNAISGYINGVYLFCFGSGYGVAWLYDGRFIVGAFVFVAGASINVRSDAILRRLRDGDGPRYRIPRGFLFEYVSCPNYLGETLEWLGWAILTWSPAGLSFLLWTAANLVPRALYYHRWYKDAFEDYPSRRRAIIPFLL